MIYGSESGGSASFEAVYVFELMIVINMVLWPMYPRSKHKRIARIDGSEKLNHMRTTARSGMLNGFVALGRMRQGLSLAMAVHAMDLRGVGGARWAS